MRYLRWLSWGIVVAAAVSLAAARLDRRVVPAGAAGGFFAGRTITYIVCTGPGGGYDTYARLVARYMGRHLGARIVVRNVEGAGHLMGLDELAAAPPDGLTMGTFTGSVFFLELSGATSDRFDFSRMSWIGKAAAEPRVLVAGARTPYRTIEDLRHATTPITLATEGAKSPAYMAGAMVSKALGLNAHLIPGFTEDDGQLAILRGDVAALLASPTSLRPLLAGGHARPLLRIGGAAAFGHDDGNVPTIDDLQGLSPENRAFLDLVASQSELGRITAAPPGVPPDRLAELRRAYRAALDDPALRAEAKRLRLPIDPADGVRTEARVRDVLSPPDHVRRWLVDPIVD